MCVSLQVGIRIVRDRIYNFSFARALDDKKAVDGLRKAPFFLALEITLVQLPVHGHEIDNGIIRTGPPPRLNGVFMSIQIGVFNNDVVSIL